MGAHTTDPSLIETGERLDVIARDPEAILGRRVFESFGPRLPFLMKLLAAAEPLSLKVHATSERARMMYTEQNVLCIPCTPPSAVIRTRPQVRADLCAHALRRHGRLP
jgi:mannose-6-phosphate isomerase